MLVRQPIVAGQFYPGSADACVKQIEDLRPPDPPEDLPERPVAGIVPHAGWVFSGGTALAVLEAIRSRRTPKTFVLFGAAHRRVSGSAIFASGAWETPLGRAEVDEWLAREILSRSGGCVTDDPRAHGAEHSLEVQVPLIQHLFPDAKLVPITVVPSEEATEVGRSVGRTVAAHEYEAVCLGSTDLTHYGPTYGFAPKGTGEEARRWVREENDRRMVDLMRRLDADAVVPESSAHGNACGGGAIAATLAAARELGAERGVLVDYTTSYDVMERRMGRGDPSALVGYAGVVF